MENFELKKKLCGRFGVKSNELYVYENAHGTFALVYNGGAQQAITSADKAKIEEIAEKTGNQKFSALLEYYKNNSQIIDAVTTFCLYKNIDYANVSEKDFVNVLNFVNKKLQNKAGLQNKDDEERFGPMKDFGNIEGYRVVDEEPESSPCFLAKTKVEKIGSKHNRTTRCFVDEIETSSSMRGCGLASTMLIKFLPALCSASYIQTIVLQAGAFDIDNEKQTQEKLEQFCKKCGFTRAQESDNLSCLTPEDFDQEYPVFTKPVSMELSL